MVKILTEPSKVKLYFRLIKKSTSSTHTYAPKADLYFGAFSPPSRTVEMVANLVGVRLNKHYVDLLAGEQHKPEYVKINPRRKVPFYVDEEVKLNESRAISAYLVNKFLPANNTLYPQDPSRRAQIDELLFIDMGALYDSAWRYYGLRLLRGTELDETAGKDLRISLKYLDWRLQNNNGKKFLLGDDFTLADISIASSLSFPDACGYSFSEFKRIHQYYLRLQEDIPQFHEINDDAIETMRTLAKKVLSN